MILQFQIFQVIFAFQNQFFVFIQYQISTRKLTYYEQKLLKNSNLYNWDTDRADQVVQSKYGITKHEQLVQYRQTARKVRDFVTALSELQQDDPVRQQLTQQLAILLFQLHLSDTPNLNLLQLKDFPAERLMKRRIVYMMKELKFAPTIDTACNFVRTGQVSIGANVIRNVNYHLKEGEEDYLCWTPGSSMAKKVDQYNQRVN